MRGPGITMWELVGRRFSRLVVLEEAQPRNGRRSWRCRCDCGRESTPLQQSLLRGSTVSCGCAAREASRRNGAANRTHGATDSAEYRTWQGMISRCENRNLKCFGRYGGRGIIVCGRWRESFVLFLSDVGPRPSPRHSIERKDNDGDYGPDNCIWATRKEQSRNRRSTVSIEVDGARGLAADWSRFTGVNESTIRHRIRAGWGHREAVFTPAGLAPPARRAEPGGSTA